jgi:hypothetical protein
VVVDAGSEGGGGEVDKLRPKGSKEAEGGRIEGFGGTGGGATLGVVGTVFGGRGGGGADLGGRGGGKELRGEKSSRGTTDGVGAAKWGRAGEGVDDADAGEMEPGEGIVSGDTQSKGL